MILKYRVKDNGDEWEEYEDLSDHFLDTLELLADYLEDTDPKIYEIKKGKTGKKIYLYKLWVREEREYYPVVEKVKRKRKIK